MVASVLFVQNPEPIFQAGFAKIAATRMKGLPICRTDIHVKALGFRPWRDYWVGAVVTPWAIFTVAAHRRPVTTMLQAGQETTVIMPAGEFSFLAVREPLIGYYLSCSLMSPLTSIKDQRTAEAFAATCLTLFFNPPANRSTP
mgnify:FL=1